MSVFVRWAVIGTMFGTFLVWSQSMAVGGLTGLLQVGEDAAVRLLITEQLGDVALAPGNGHDGQIFYAIALDLGGEFVPDLLDHGGYRYRRILFPLISSGFGLLEGWPLLYGMIVMTVLSAGVATGATAWLASRGGLSELAALAVLLNPGVWLSVRLLTSDMLALALMVAGLALVHSRVRPSAGLFALSALAKDVFLITSVGMALGRDRKRWILAAVPIAALLGVMLWTTLVIGDGFTGRGNLAFPFMGIRDASRNWGTRGVDDLFYLVFALVSVVSGLIIGIGYRSWLRWPILGWSVLGLVSSSWVWDFGNNAARAFAPLAVLMVLSLARQPDVSSLDPLRSGPGPEHLS